ncbi:hypothetical protein I7I51_00352 [Histoplasma capsulatum]|uniref:Uncharacterized protein n=1 Tax=Ajellomyces capsulatus TaxID=5037 RepID=A0A8A1MBT7_AJECA|nr:hypothetical protein I7I51_00352 [Histoplasma capsulatum]
MSSTNFCKTSPIQFWQFPLHLLNDGILREPDVWKASPVLALGTLKKNMAAWRVSLVSFKPRPRQTKMRISVSAMAVDKLDNSEERMGSAGNMTEATKDQAKKGLSLIARTQIIPG